MGEAADVNKPIGGRFGERPVERRRDVLRHRLPQCPNLRYRFQQPFGRDRHGGWAGVGRFASQHFVEDAAQRVLVASAIETGFAHPLLGAHVDGRAEHEAGLRERGAAIDRDGPGYPEVGDDGAAIFEENVLGLDVAMDDPARMRVRERGGDLAGDAECVAYGELAFAVETGAERLPLDQRHHVEEQPVGASVGGAGVVEREDVGVPERRGGPDLPEKPLRAECVPKLGAENLDGDQSVVLAITGQIHRGHPALPQLALDGVAVGEGGAEMVEGAHRGKLARGDVVHYFGVHVRCGIARRDM